MQQQLASEVEQELVNSPERLHETMRLRLPSIVRVVHRRLFHLYERADHMVRTTEEEYVPQSDDLADRSLDRWFPMDDSTFRFDSSLDQFPNPFSEFDTTYSEVLKEKIPVNSSESSE